MIEVLDRPNAAKLRVVELPLYNTAVMTEQMKRDAVESASISPVLSYYGLQIPLSNIRKLEFYNNGFSPTLFASFVDTTNIMVDRGYPTDDSYITVYIPSNSRTVRPIQMNFKILQFNVTDSGGERRMQVYGACDVPLMYVNQHKAYRDAASWAVLRSVAADCGLGFASNISGTRDAMTWINPGLDVIDFVQDTTAHAWNGDSGFMWSYVDPYYNLNFVDVETAMAQDATVQQAPMSVPRDQSMTEPQEVAVTLNLTNDRGAAGSNLYFAYYDLVNQSTKISLQNGYVREVYYYDRFGNWSDRAGTFLSMAVDSITTPGAESTSVIMKGSPQDETFYRQNVGLHYAGKFDPDNVHKDFHYAWVQNDQNIGDIQKVYVTITMPTPNLFLHRYQKVLLTFSNNALQFTGQQANQRLSGQWLVTGIVYKFSSKNHMTQEVTLVKRELNVIDISK